MAPLVPIYFYFLVYLYEKQKPRINKRYCYKCSPCFNSPSYFGRTGEYIFTIRHLQGVKLSGVTKITAISAANILLSTVERKVPVMHAHLVLNWEEVAINIQLKAEFTSHAGLITIVVKLPLKNYLLFVRR